MERFKLHIEAESRIRWKVYVRFGGEFSETDHSNMARRRLLSLHPTDLYVLDNPFISACRLHGNPPNPVKLLGY